MVYSMPNIDLPTNNKLLSYTAVIIIVRDF